MFLKEHAVKSVSQLKQYNATTQLHDSNTLATVTISTLLQFDEYKVPTVTTKIVPHNASQTLSQLSKSQMS